MKLEVEVWKKIKNYSNYEVSNLGNVKSKKRYTKIKNGVIALRKELILNGYIDKKGYKIVILYSNKKPKAFRVHRLVAQAFIPNSLNKPEVNHKDGRKLNNNVLNLEWNTTLENIKHSIENGLVDTELRKSNMSKLGRSKKALMKRWGISDFKSAEYVVDSNA